MQCPTQETLESFLSGSDISSAPADLEDHLCDCRRCGDLLRVLSAVPSLPAEQQVPRQNWSDAVADRLAVRLESTADAGTDDPDLRLPFSIGSYELLEVIGRGGMGTVYRARQTELDRKVAVKMITRQFLKPSLVERFYAEARAAAMLDHSGIVPVYDVGRFGAHVYFAMALVPGGTLAQRLSRGPLELRQAAKLLREIALAVHFAHVRGVIHRDLKPSNILLEPDGRPKVADFGLAKQIESGADLTVSGEILGTPEYMSPEQAGGPGGVTVASDVYGLGAILYHLLTGHPPFTAGTPAAVLYQVVHESPPQGFGPEVSRDLRTIVLKCLAKRPEERYETAAEVARELDRYLNGEPIEAARPSLLGRVVRWCQRHPALASMSAATLAAVLIGSGLSTYFGVLANQRSARLTTINTQLEKSQQEASRSAQDARASAAMATEQANAAMQILESTLYDLQDVVTNNPAEQQQRKLLLNSVLQALDGLNQEFIARERLLRCLATTNLGLAEVVMQIGDDSGRIGLAASRDRYQQAIEQFQTLFDAAPDDATSSHDLADALKEFADMLAEAGRWREAYAYFQRALPICERLARESPGDAVAQGRLAEMEVFCGECLVHTGRLAEGGELLERARDRCTRVLARFPDSMYLRGELVHACVELGDWHVLNKDLDAAQSCFLQMKQEATEITLRAPGDSKAVMDLSTSWERLGDISSARGASAKGLSEYLESLKIAEAAGRTAPLNDQLQWEVSFGYQKVADAYLRSGDARAARDAARSCVEIRRGLALRDPSNGHLHAKLLHALSTLARSCERQRDFAEAIQWHQEKLRFATNFHAQTKTQRFASQMEQATAAVQRCQHQLDQRTPP